MKTKRIQALLLVMSMLFSMLVLPQSVSALEYPNNPTDPDQNDAYTVNVGDDTKNATTYSNDRADLVYKYLGTTGADVTDLSTITSKSQLDAQDKSDFRWEKGGHVWIGVELTNLDRIRKLFEGGFFNSDGDIVEAGLSGMQISLAYDPTYFAVDADNVVDTIAITYTSTFPVYTFQSQYQNIAIDDDGFDTPITLGTTADPTDANDIVYTGMKIDDSRAGQAAHDQMFKWTSSDTVDGSAEYLVAAFALEMLDEPADLTGLKLIQGYMNSDGGSIDVGNKNTQGFTFTWKADDGDTDMANYFNILNDAIDFPAGPPTITFSQIDSDTTEYFKAKTSGDSNVTSRTADPYESSSTYYITQDILNTGKGYLDTAALAADNLAFAGWYEDQDYNTPYTITGTPGNAITTSKTLYAKFDTAYTVSYYANSTAGGAWKDGTAAADAKTESVADGGKPSLSTYEALLTPPTGYKFKGWNTAADGTGTDFGSTDTISAATDLYAQYERKKATVSFEKGTAGTDDVKYDVSAITDTDDPNYDASGKKEPYVKEVLADTTSDNIMLTKADADAIAALLDYDATKYRFTGWAKDGTPVDWTGAVGSEYLVIEGDTSLTPIITQIDYKKVTFDSNGGNPTTAQTLDVEKGQKLSTGGKIEGTNDTVTPPETFAITAPTRTGYTFTGWYTDPDDSSTKLTKPAEVTINGDTVIYRAGWERNTLDVTVNAFKFGDATEGNVSWFGDTGSESATGTYTIEANESDGKFYVSISDLEAMLNKLDNYDIEGWYTDSTFSTALNDKDEITSGTPIYVQLEKKSIQVTFKVDKTEAAFGTLSSATDNDEITKTIYAKAGDGGNIYLDSTDLTTYAADIVPTDSNYEFASWHFSSKTGSAANTSTPITSSNNEIWASLLEKTVYHIKFEAPDADATYSVNGGLGLGVHEGNTVAGEGYTQATDYPDPVRVGYKFLGWYTNATNKTGAFDPTTAVTADATYNAAWEVDKKVATFHADAHSNFNGTASDTKDYDIKANATPAYVITSTHLTTAESDLNLDPGYEVEGWYKDSGLTQKITSDYTITANTNVYVKTQVVSHKVTYKIGNVGTTGGVLYDTNSDGTGDSVSYEETINAITDKTDTDAGKVIVDSAKLTTSEGKLDIPSIYEFDSWNDKADGSGTTYSGGEAITSDVTLFAIVKEKTTHTVTFEATDADPAYTTVSITVHDGFKLSDESTSNTVEWTNTDNTITTFKVEDPARPNYVFLGWYVDGDTTKEAYADSTEFTEDKTYKAAWQLDVVDVTFKDTKTSPQADIVYTVNANKKLSDSDSGAIAKDIGDGLTIADTTIAVNGSVTDVPDDPDAPTNYMFYGWYTLKDNTVDLTNDVLTQTTKTDMDALVTAGDIIEFDDNVSVGTTAFNVYALYVLSDNAKLKPNDDDGDPNGAIFKEFNASGANIPLTASDYLPVQEPEHEKAALTAAGKTPPTYNLSGRTAATFDPDKTYKSTDTPPNEFYMVVENEVDEAYTELTTVNPGSTLVIKKKGLDTDGVTVIWTTVTSTANTTTGTNTATLALDVTENKSANEFLVTITAPDGTTEAQYKFNILRFAIPEVKLSYGNSPAGLIYRDDESFPTEADKEAALDEFKVSDPKPKKGVHTNLQLGTGGKKVPIISGSETTGDAVYAQTSKYYTTSAWKDYDENYDFNKYVYFVYQNKTIKPLSAKFIDDYGVESTPTFNITTTLDKQTKVGPSVYTDDTNIQKLVFDSMVNPTFSLAKTMIRPHNYDMTYVYNYTKAYGNSEAYSAIRPLIILSRLGDVYLTSNASANANDSKYLLNYTAKVNKGHSLIAFRSGDVVYSASPSVNANDSKYLLNYTAKVNKSTFDFYPDIN